MFHFDLGIPFWYKFRITLEVNMTEKPEYSPGLEGVIAGETSICEIDQERASLTFRGYDIKELAVKSSYEETAYLLLYGLLPSKAQLAEFDARLKEDRGVPDTVVDVYRQTPVSAHSMDVLRTGVSILGMFDPEEGDNSHDANVRKAIRIISKMPTLVAYGSRLPQGLEPVEPRGDLSLSENFLYMLHGVVQDQPGPHIFDKTLIVYAEHEFNASSFSARVTSSTLSDMHSAVTSAVGTLKGPLHGGANEAVMQMLLEIKEPGQAEPWIMDALGNKKRIMGFGHRVYKHGDTRAPILRQASRELCESQGFCKWHELAVMVEETVKREKGLLPNVDFYTASIYYLLGLPIPAFTPVFAMARSAGWCAHAIEQLDNNRLIRPRSIYTGFKGLHYVPIDERDWDH